MKSSFVILLFILWATLSLAQPGAYDPTFDIGSGFNGQVRTVVVQNNGKILVGGFFTSYKSNTANRIIRLENDGNVDNTFVVGAGFNAMVRTIAVQSNGKILVGGDFTNFHLTPINRIIRLEADGSVDASFNANVGTGFDQEVNIVAIQPNGKILVGGDFTSYNTTSVGRLVRLESNGSIDAGFNAGGAGFNSWVTAIAVQSNGKIIVGGDFTSYNGNSRNRIVRLNEDGSIDNTFNVGTGFNGGVTSIAIQPDGKILVVGGFTSYQGNTANRIIRLNADGSIDATFNTGSGFNITAMTVVLQPDNKILVGGFFTDYNGNTRNRIIRLNSNGSIDNSFNIGSGFDALGVLSIALQADGKILAGGGFTSYNTHTPNRIVRLFNCPFNVSISPTNVNDGMVGLPYDPVSFSQTGLTGTITWSISSGTLPPGLALNSSTGVLSGTPTIAGNYNFTIQASNGSCSVTANYSITILPAAPRVQVDNTVLDFGEVPLMQSSIREITIKNVGALPLQITAIPATKEVFKYGFIGFETIAPGQSRKFSLYFTPTEAQTYNDIYTIISNAIGTPSTISVTGKGVVVNSITNYQPICEVYPNPTQDYLKVRFKQSSEFEVSVADVNGKICLKEKSYTPEKILDLRKLGKGIYFLQIFTNNESQRVKFVKM